MAGPSRSDEPSPGLSSARGADADAELVSSVSLARWTAIDPVETFHELIDGDLSSYVATTDSTRGADLNWEQDFLGPNYYCATLLLGHDDEGPVEATIVKYQPAPELRTARAILYIHGWCDYFFQTETAEFWHNQGVAFYAIDLRKYGRSLRDGQTPGYTHSLSVYSQEISTALQIIRAEQGAHVSTMLMGHSTGGLVCSLWAHHNPGQVSGLILNSPWLEMQGSSVVRILATPGLSQLARVQPKAALPNIDYGFYTRTVSKEFEGEWEVNPQWRPNPSFPVRPGWLSAIAAGHAQVARGLDLDIPVIMLASAKTAILMRWSEEIRTSDAVLDVDVISRRAVQLGSNVTIIRVKGGLHDLALSPRPIRRTYYEAIQRWTMAYGWSG